MAGVFFCFLLLLLVRLLLEIAFEDFLVDFFEVEDPVRDD